MAYQIVSAQQAYNDILSYIRQHGGVFRSWYVGVASDARKRLFADHHVPENNAWILCICSSETAARAVEQDLLRLGCDGGSGGGHSSSNQVYAYQKTGQTRQ